MSAKPLHLKKYRQKVSPSDTLKAQKQLLKTTLRFYGTATFFWFGLALVVLFAGLREEDPVYAKRTLLIGVPCFFAIPCAFLVQYLKRKKIYRDLCMICPGTVKIVPIQCEKVRCFRQPVTKIQAKIICMELTDKQGNTYFYIPYDQQPLKSEKALKRKLLSTPHVLTCYDNSQYVSTCEPLA